MEQREIAERHQHYETIKGRGGDGISTWHEARLQHGSPGVILARDTICGGPCCATDDRTTLRGPCGSTHMAGPFQSFSLKEGKPKPPQRPHVTLLAAPPPAQPPSARAAAPAPPPPAAEDSDSDDDVQAQDLESADATLRVWMSELGRPLRRGERLAAFALSDPARGDAAYELLLLTSAVTEHVDGLVRTVCTGHPLRPVPGVAPANRLYFAEAEATETRLWSADTVCIAANVLSDAVVERDDVAVDGQLDDRRIHVPAALHVVLNGHAEECHEGRWFGAAAAAGS